VPKILGTKSEWEGTSDWFYLDKSKAVQGPITASALKELWKTEKIFSDTWIWHEKIQDWKKVEQAKEVLHWLQKA